MNLPRRTTPCRPARHGGTPGPGGLLHRRGHRAGLLRGLVAGAHRCQARPGLRRLALRRGPQGLLPAGSALRGLAPRPRTTRPWASTCPGPTSPGRTTATAPTRLPSTPRAPSAASPPPPHLPSSRSTPRDTPPRSRPPSTPTTPSRPTWRRLHLRPRRPARQGLQLPDLLRQRALGRCRPQGRRALPALQLRRRSWRRREGLRLRAQRGRGAERRRRSLRGQRAVRPLPGRPGGRHH